jgi:hypothetical protein
LQHPQNMEHQQNGVQHIKKKNNILKDIGEEGF